MVGLLLDMVTVEAEVPADGKGKAEDTLGDYSNKRNSPEGQDNNQHKRVKASNRTDKPTEQVVMKHEVIDLDQESAKTKNARFQTTSHQGNPLYARRNLRRVVAFLFQLPTRA